MTRTTYHIILGPIADSELNGLRVFEHRRLRDAIVERLEHEPLVQNRNRKPLVPTPPELAPAIEGYFPEGLPVWELRVGAWRVIYVIEAHTVFVLRVVKKGRQTTSRSLS